MSDFGKTTIFRLSAQATKRHRHIGVKTIGEEVARDGTCDGGATNDFFEDEDMENLFYLELSRQEIFENKVRIRLGNLE